MVFGVVFGVVLVVVFGCCLGCFYLQLLVLLLTNYFTYNYDYYYYYYCCYYYYHGSLILTGISVISELIESDQTTNRLLRRQIVYP